MRRTESKLPLSDNQIQEMLRESKREPLFDRKFDNEKDDTALLITRARF